MKETTMRTADSGINTAPIDRVIHYITEGIKDQSLAPGQRLIEQEIVANTGISRTPVRQALRILAGEGLVELLPNRGARLKRMSRHDIIDMITILGHLCSFGIAKAIEHLDDPGARQKLREAIAKITNYSATRRPYDFFSSIIDYHRILHQIGHQPVLNEVLDKLHMEYYLRELASAVTVQDWDRYLNRYQTLNHLILSKKTDEAIELLKTHLEYLNKLLALPREKSIY